MKCPSKSGQIVPVNKSLNDFFFYQQKFREIAKKYNEFYVIHEFFVLIQKIKKNSNKNFVKSHSKLIPDKLLHPTDHGDLQLGV